MRKFFCFWARGPTPEEPNYLPGYKPVGKLQKAASQGDLDKIQHILRLRRNHISKADKKKRTALHYACAYGQAEAAKLLVHQKSNIHARDSNHCTPLIKAVQHRHTACVILLLQNGANPNDRGALKKSALHYAVSNDDAETVTTLLDFHVDTDVRTEGGITPLMACVLGEKHQVASLLVRKADVNATDDWGRSALSHAVMRQSKSMVQLLLDNGADDTLVDSFGLPLKHYILTQNLGVIAEKPPAGTGEVQKEPPESNTRQTESAESCSPRLNNQPGPGGSFPKTKEDDMEDPIKASPAPLEAKPQRTAGLPWRDKGDLSELDALARDIEQQVLNHPGRRKKWPGGLFSNRGQCSDLPDLTEQEEEMKMKPRLSNWDRRDLILEEIKRQRENCEDSDSEDSSIGSLLERCAKQAANGFSSDEMLFSDDSEEEELEMNITEDKIDGMGAGAPGSEGKESSSYDSEDTLARAPGSAEETRHQVAELPLREEDSQEQNQKADICEDSSPGETSAGSESSGYCPKPRLLKEVLQDILDSD